MLKYVAALTLFASLSATAADSKQDLTIGNALTSGTCVVKVMKPVTLGKGESDKGFSHQNFETRTSVDIYFTEKSGANNANVRELSVGRVLKVRGLQVGEGDLSNTLLFDDASIASLFGSVFGGSHATYEIDEMQVSDIATASDGALLMECASDTPVQI